MPGIENSEWDDGIRMAEMLEAVMAADAARDELGTIVKPQDVTQDMLAQIQSQIGEQVDANAAARAERELTPEEEEDLESQFALWDQMNKPANVVMTIAGPMRVSQRVGGPEDWEAFRRRLVRCL